LVFDCDGVILDSNRAKTEAFRAVACAEYGAQAAEGLVSHHVANGGVSRYRKFEHLLGTILGLPVDQDVVMRLSTRFGDCVREKLMQCPVSPGLKELRDVLRDSSWMVVSGGAQAELRDVFRARGLDRYFDRGIFGSPDAKDEILAREMDAGRLALPALFLGDSAHDHHAAAAAGLDFVFVHGWTEFDGWREYCDHHGLDTISGLGELLPGSAFDARMPQQRRERPD
jgi:phosphoglycolate phosphatase-like HAD superfamily hydrolase